MKYIIQGNKIGNVINVLINGMLLSKTCDDAEQAKQIFTLVLETKKNPTEESVKKLKTALVGRKFTTINSLISFDPETKDYFYKDYDVAMPEELAQTMIDYVENGYPTEALENFWQLLITCPDKNVQADAFKFLMTYNFTITDHGYVMGYKAVTHKEIVENDLKSFVSNSFVKIKSWKKSAAKYSILRDLKSELFLVENNNISLDSDSKKEYVGRLDQLYNDLGNLPEGTQFTDKHSKTMNIVLGRPVIQDRAACNPNPSNECSYGLHVGSVKYVERFANSEDTILLVLFNPQHIVAVPRYDNSKMRVCEYFPMAVLQRSEDKKSFETVETPYFEYDYLNYEKAEIKATVERLTKKKIEEPQNVTMADEQRLKILKNRLVDITKYAAIK